MMRGQTEAAVAACDRVIAMRADEPDDYVRAIVLGQITATLAICGAFDRLDLVTREAASLAEQLDNHYLLANARTDSRRSSTSPTPIEPASTCSGATSSTSRTATSTPIARTRCSSRSTRLRSRNDVAAAQWARKALQLSLDHGPSYIAQTLNATVAIVRRHSPADAAVLLGALRAHRDRKHQDGTTPEIESEIRYEASLRRALGAAFDENYTRGLALDEAAMIALAFDELDAIVSSEPGP